MTSETESTMQELATAAAAHAEATKRVDETREARDQAIRAAAATGESRSAIARTAGVSREIVYRVIGALVVAVLAILTLSACGSDEPAAQPVSQPSATLEPTNEPTDDAPDCWSVKDPAYWELTDALNADTTYEAQIVLLRQLPPVMAGCKKIDRETLTTLLAERDRIEKYLADHS